MSSEPRHNPDPWMFLAHERRIHRSGCGAVAGIDEAGRGPLAGPVVAAAVVLPTGMFLPGVNDSKQMKPAEREDAYAIILHHARAVGVGVVGEEIIDRINILNATFMAMRLAVEELPVRPDHLLVDGNRFLDIGIPFTTIVGGDASSLSIAAASVVAKVTRDRLMVEYDRRFPGYGFAHHKGYATREHCDAIARLGYCSLHRRSFHLRESLPLR